MNKVERFNRIREDLENKIHLLKDKPEETIDTTLKALWFASSGFPVSAERALELSLPELTEMQEKKLHQLIEQRLTHIPLAYITNRQNFMGIELISDKRALIPRKETEILGKKAIELSRKIVNSKGRIIAIDVCCGSGNLGIALAHFNPNCFVYATDISQEAVELAQDNINFLNLNNVQAKQGDLLNTFETSEFYEKIDLIVCNPPYILSSKVMNMDVEIASNEPTLAFDGGMLGIKIIQKLISEAPKFLKPGGWLAFEVGVGQGNFISQLCKRTGLYNLIETVADESDNIRVIMAQKSN